MSWIEKANRLRAMQRETLEKVQLLFNDESRLALLDELENDPEFQAWSDSQGDPDLCLLDHLKSDIDQWESNQEFQEIVDSLREMPDIDVGNPQHPFGNKLSYA